VVRETVDAIFGKGPEKALTGPVSRGDVAAVRRQLAMVRDWDPAIGDLYRDLGLVAVALLVELGDRDAYEFVYFQF